MANVIARTGGMSGRFEWRPQYATGPAPFRWSQGDVSVSGSRGDKRRELGIIFSPNVPGSF